MKDLLSTALRCYLAGNLAQAELISQAIVRRNSIDLGDAKRLLGMICLSTGNVRAASELLKPRSESGHYAKLAQFHLERSNEILGLRKTEAPSPQQFILIKAWGYGFWSDIDHLLGQLLVAEISGRTPVVHWGDNSLFQGENAGNAFSHFFEPLTPYSIDDLTSQNYSFFPNKWTSKNIMENDVNKWNNEGSRVPGFFFLERNEDVVVSDFHTYLFDLISWIPRSHSLFGATAQSVYRQLAQKYLIPKPHLTQQADEFFEKQLSGHTTIAVHIRGSDKARESANLSKTNESYFDVIDRLISKYPDALLFILTDDQHQFQKFSSKYRSLVRATACKRTSTNEGVHHSTAISGQRLGEEVLADVLIAAQCDFFVGNGASNVSTSILHMKYWLPENTILLDRNHLFQEHFSLHNW